MPPQPSSCTVAHFVWSSALQSVHSQISSVSANTLPWTTSVQLAHPSICSLIACEPAGSVTVQPSHLDTWTTGSSGSTSDDSTTASPLRPSTTCTFALLGPSSAPFARAFASLSSSSFDFGADARSPPSSSRGASAIGASAAKSRVHSSGTALRSATTTVFAAPSLSTLHRQSSTTTTAGSSPAIVSEANDSCNLRASKEHLTDDAASAGILARSSTSLLVCVHEYDEVSPPEYVPGT